MIGFPPETKDWTWVLERACPECGMDTTTETGPDVGPLVRRVAVKWAHVLAVDPDPAQRRRPDRWSRLEYACHVRDVFRIGDQRLGAMLAEDNPSFANWDQDATAAEHDYAGQEPAVVAGEVVEAAELVTVRLEAVTPEAWSKPGRRSDGASFTVESFARYLVHDPVHHLWDVRPPTR